MSETQVIDVTAEPVDPPAPPEPTALASLSATTVEKMSEPEMIRAMAQHGMIVPISTPDGLRQLYSMRQKMYAAILEENDYLWIVTYPETRNGRTYGRQYIARNRADAEERAESIPQSSISAKPVKSGVQKLAEALGITTRCVVREERKYFNRAGVYCEYEARHERTGKVETGVGFCGVDERGGKISVHDMITTADTRAYNRAVLRLAAFGDVSAEEVIAGVGTSELPEFVPDGALTKEAAPLPEMSDDDVVAAVNAYVAAVSERPIEKRWAPDAKQDTLAARTTRAAARRGDRKAAHQLGTLGLLWGGIAQDGPDFMTFDVANLDLVEFNQQTGADTAEKPDRLVEALGGESKPAQANGSGGKEGWNLSGDKKNDDAGLPKDLPDRHEPPKASAEAKEGLPSPDPRAETITVAQAKKLSRLAVEVMGGKEAAKAWMTTECHVAKATEIRSNQYETIMSVLNKKKEG